MDKPRIGILTPFDSFPESYSLTSVVEAQLSALVKYGYKPVFFVLNIFKDDDKVPEGVEIRKIVPQITLYDYSGHQDVLENFDNQVDLIYKALKEHTQDIDILIEHDMIFQGWFLPHCVAIHKLAKETKIKWFHWTHSVPSSAPNSLKHPHHLRYVLPNNSKLVYLNNVNLIRAAEAYELFPKDVRIVHNPVDPRLYWRANPLVKKIIDEFDILSADFVQTYPLSTTRMVDGKQIRTVIDIFAKLKTLGKRVRLIICNAHANDKREKQVIAETFSYAATKGLNANELIFTSFVDIPKYEMGVSREVVTQLFQLSNVFIFPTISENCPLILLEAMLAKNLLVLNENVGALREFGRENALYFKFGSNTERVDYANRDKFMEDVARIIISEFEINRPLKANRVLLQEFNYDKVFKQSIEPLFYES